MPRKPRFPDYPGINKFYHDRHGRPRFYVDGIAIKARPFNSPAFRDEYERALLSTEDKPAPKLGTIHGSFRWVCERYIKANENPTTPTQHERRLRLESMWLEPWTPGDPQQRKGYFCGPQPASHSRVLLSEIECVNGCDEAGLKHCSAHGLRHAAASYYASQPETTIIELCDMFGFTPRTAETYMRKRKQPENARRLQMRVRGMAA